MLQHHSILVAFLVPCLVAALSSTASAAGRHDGSHLHELTCEVVTPHLDWAKQLEGGPVKALFIVPRNLAAREVVELAERVELDFDAVTTGHHGALGRDDVYNAAVTGTTTFEKTQELIDKLDKPYQVIVLANFDLHALPAEAQYKVLKQVSDGAGLLITFPRAIKYKKLLEQKTEDWQQVVSGADPAGLPEKQSRREKPLVSTYRFGKGRLTTINYGSTPAVTEAGPGLADVETFSPQWQARYENNMALVARALLGAAGRELRGGITLGQYDPRRGLPLQCRDIPAGATVALRLRDAENRLLLEQSLRAAPSLTLRVPPLAAGRHYLDFRVEVGGRTRTFGYQPFDVPLPFASLSLEATKPSWEPGEPVALTLKLGTAAKGSLRLVTHIEDSPYGKVWARQESTLPAGETATALQVAVPAMPTIAGYVVCTIHEGERVVARAYCEVFFPQRHRELFPTMLWNAIPNVLSRPLATQLVDELGWRAGLTHPAAEGNNARINALMNTRFVPYMTRIGINSNDGVTSFAMFMGVPAKEIEAAGNKTDGSFYNPAIQELWKKAIAARIVNLPLYGPMVYNLGDENHFSYDAGYAPSDEKAFREYLRQRYQTIENLNREWQTSYGGFDQVEHEKPDALRAKGRFAAWFDHRRYMEKQYADVHHFLSEQIKAIDPHAQVGAEGSVPGDLELTISKLDFWGPYSNPVHDELLRSIGGDRLRMLWWGGYVGSHGGRDVYPFPLWRPLLQGVVNGNSWYSASVSAEGFLGADLRQADYFKQMRPHLRALDQGQAQLLISQPLRKDGIAILWSHASHSASLMDERFFKPGDSINALMQFCYRKGLNFDFLTTSMVEQGKLDGYKVLVLCGASALSGAERRRIESFANDGGVVIADLKPGVLNDYCRPLERSSLGQLMGVDSLTWDQKLEMKPVDVRATVRGRSIEFRADRAWQSPNIQPFTHRAAGRGLAILLNFNLGSAVNTASRQTPVDGLLSDLLALADVRPVLKVTGPDAEQLLVRLRESGGGRTLGMLAAKKDIGKSFQIELDKPAFVYEVGGKALGRLQCIEGMMASPFKLYCLFETEPAALSLELDRSSIALGQAAALDLSALPAEGVYRLEVRDAQDQLLLRRLQVLTGRDRSAPVELRFAFNDEPGQYTVVLTDVRTNQSVRAPLTVSPQ